MKGNLIIEKYLALKDDTPAEKGDSSPHNVEEDAFLSIDSKYSDQ